MKAYGFKIRSLEMFFAVLQCKTRMAWLILRMLWIGRKAPGLRVTWRLIKLQGEMFLLTAGYYKDFTIDEATGQPLRRLALVYGVNPNEESDEILREKLLEILRNAGLRA